ncbi:NECA1 protein, partial [Odontophorus gujanensis]|nr:NECA1 protein [Odontophorus gujanensis]
MACAELLAVCLLPAKPGPEPRREPLPIFHDVNDGKLSFEEFKNYFADGILSSEELWELFSGIDRRHSETGLALDHLPAAVVASLQYWDAPSAHWSVLCAYWGRAPGTSPFPSFYETSSKMEQFLTRFLLRETTYQLQSLQGSIECAVDTMEEQAGRERKDIKKSETLVGLRSGRRCGHRGQKNICLSPTDPYSGMLNTGTHSPAIPGCVRGSGGLPPPCFCPGWPGWGVGALCAELCPLFPSVPSSGCSCPRSVSACKLTDEACFILYEFWQDAASWRSHLQSSHSKAFQRATISLLESPELLTTMLFPGEWGLDAAI